jgi:murein DD-endopeptidase MepM/ murein hydrolase activator NlpD
MTKISSETAKRIVAAFLALAINMFLFSPALAEDSVDLQTRIGQKNLELDAIKTQIGETQEKLDVLGNQSDTLERQLSSIDYELNQINLGIRSSEVSIEKLGLEIDALDARLVTTKSEIGDKRGAIAELIRELNETDRQGMLFQVLQGKSLADTILELKTIQDFQDSLSVNVAELNDLVGQIDSNIRESVEKKNELKVEQQTLLARQDIAKDTRAGRQELLNATKNQEKIYQSQLAKLEAQRAATEKEIGEYEESLRVKINPAALPVKRSGVLQFPVPGGTITQGYGRTSFAIRTYSDQWHNGIDIGRYLGAQIVAAEDGEVVAVGNQDLYCPKVGYGNYIVIRHDNNLVTLYGHLSRYVVQKGQRVSRGQLIGYMGKTGWSTGPHLHFTVFSAATYILRASKYCGPFPVGGDINPLSYL